MKKLIVVVFCFGLLNSIAQSYKNCKIDGVTYSIGDSIILSKAGKLCKGFDANDNQYNSYCSVKYKAKDGKYYSLPSKYKGVTLIIKDIKEDDGITYKKGNGSYTTYIFEQNYGGGGIYCECYSNQFTNIIFYLNLRKAESENEIAINKYSLDADTKVFYNDDAFNFYCKLSQKPVKILAEESLKSLSGSYDFNKKYGVYGYEQLSVFDKADAIEKESKEITEKISQVDLSKTYYIEASIKREPYDAESQSYKIDYNEIRTTGLKIATSKYEYATEINTNDLVINKVKFKIINQDFFLNDKLQIPFDLAKYFDKRDFYSLIFFKVVDDSADMDKEVIKIKITEIAFFDNNGYTTNLIGKIQ